jgi:subtilisin family serine protease
MEETAMRLRTFTAAVVALILLLIPDGAVQANSKSFGFVEVITEEPEGLATEFYPLNENEAMYFTVHDGVVQGESTIQLDEMDVIVQIKDEPLSLLRRRRGVAIASAAVELERVHDLVKSEIVRLEGEVRRAKRVSPRPSQQIIKRQYQYVFNGLAARVSKETIQQIEKLPQVKQVWTDGIVRASLSESVPLIRANQVWNSLGVTGHGITVAIIDTGIDYTHHDLGECFGKGCKVIGGYDFVNRDNNPMDDHGHGTHVAGIVAANGMIKGVAPDANLMAFKVLDRYGRGMTSDVIAGIERAVDPDGNPATDDGAHVINLSLGGSGHPDDPLCQAVDNAVAAGVVVAVAAGNSGPSYETLESPGVARQAITVGASDKNNRIASFSSRGPAPITYQIKPEVLAPGVGITSTVPSGACSLCNSSGYQSLSGTSMATPHVAGTAALLLARFPIWTPEQVKEALMEQSISLLLNVYSQGSGRIDAYASATLLAIGSPGNLSLGLDDLSQPVFSVQKTLNLTNLSTFSQTYGLSVQGGFDNRIMAKITPATLTLAPGQTGSFTFDLKLNNSEVPNVTNPPNAYEGNVVVKGGGETLAIPFTFIKSPILEVTFDEEPWMLNVHNRVNASWNISYPGLSRALLLPADVYDVIALFKDITTRVIREDVGVETKTTLKISKGEAVYPLTTVFDPKHGNFHLQTQNHRIRWNHRVFLPFNDFPFFPGEQCLSL